MKSSIIYKSLLALAAPFLLAACGNEETPDMPVIDDNFEGIMLSIPAAGITRGDDTHLDASSDEAKITSLTVIAYPQTVSGQVKGTRYNNTFTLGDANPSYIYDQQKNYYKVPVSLVPGSYHIYVLANVAADDLKTSSNQAVDFSSITETNLAGVKLVDQSPIKVSDLSTIPMTCDNNELQSAAGLSGNEFTNNIVEIAKGKATAVYANLTFAYAKVRLTLLNDVASGLTTPQTIKLLNSAKQIGAYDALKTLSTTGSTLEDKDITSGGSAYKCPADVPTTETGTGSLADFNVENISKGGSYDAENDETWAWQGSWYVPERLFNTDNEEKPALSIAFDAANSAYNKDYTLSNGLERSTYYDFVGYVKNKIVTIQVRVNKWNYYKAPIIDLE